MEKGNKPSVAVLIPCLNEGKTIGTVVRSFKKVLSDSIWKDDYTIYICDNHSDDDTGRKASESGATVMYLHQKGKGAAVRYMFHHIDADCYVLVDGDDTYSANDCLKMIDLVINHGLDMVIGDRLSGTYFTENKRPFHNSGNKLVRYLVNHVFRGDITDVMTGYRAMSKRFVGNYPCHSDGFEIETEMSIFTLQNGYAYRNIPVSYKDREEGSVSKINTIKDGAKILGFIGKAWATNFLLDDD